MFNLSSLKILSILFLLAAFVKINAQVVSTASPFDYGTGAEGAYTAPAGASKLSGVHNYSSFTIPVGSTVSDSGTAPLVIKCTGTATINGTLTAVGANGGNTQTSTPGAGGSSSNGGGVNGGGGGVQTGSPGTSFGTSAGAGGNGTPTTGGGYGGSGGGYGTAGGYNGLTYAGQVYGDSNLVTVMNGTNLLGGSGGGGGGGNKSSRAGAGGGSGGGAFSITAHDIVVGAAGLITVKGGNGGQMSDATSSTGGAGGGGSGGTILLQYLNSLTGTLTTNTNYLITAAKGIDYSAGEGGIYYIGQPGGQGRYRAQQDTAKVACALTDTITTAICQGANYDGHTASGTYFDSFTTAGGCDSIRTLVLTVTPAIKDTIVAKICQGTNYNGHTTTGTYIDTFVATGGGCDSIRTLNLTVVQPIKDTITTTICHGLNYDGHATTGIFTDIFTAFSGCDSIRTLNLTVNPPITDTITTTICQNLNYDGHTATGKYIDSFTTIGGCDSIRVLNLTVTPTIRNTITTNICHGTNYDGHTATGTYVDTITASGGCDSIRTLNLTIDSTYYNTFKAHICAGDSYNGHSTPGNFTDTFHSVNHCDSIVNLELEVDSLPSIPEIKQVGDSLTTSQSYFQYFWYTADSIAIGDSTGTLGLSSSGDYFVQVADSGSLCRNSSSLFHAVLTGIGGVNEQQPVLSIFPNPATDKLNIRLSGISTTNEVAMKLYDATGKLVLEKVLFPEATMLNVLLDLKDIVAGLYLIQIRQDGWNTSSKVLIMK